MKLTIELTHVSEYETAAKTLLAFHAALVAQEAAPIVEAPKPKKVKAAAPAPEPVAEPQQPEDDSRLEIEFSEERPTEPAIEPPSDAEIVLIVTPTPEQARDALSEYSVKHGMTAARELLAKYGAQRVSDVKDDVRAAFIAEMGL